MASSTDTLKNKKNNSQIVSLPFLFRFPAPNGDKINPEIRHVDVVSPFLKALELAGFYCLLVTT
jgi:hypothetical protein